MKATALEPPPPGARGREGIEDCVAFGYCPADRMSWAVSRTLEYAWADGSIALLAGTIGGWLNRSPRTQVVMNRLAGMVFVGLALKLATVKR